MVKVEWLLLSIILLSVTWSITSDDSETIFYLADPQIGFSGDLNKDTTRFGQAATAATSSNATAIVIAGDLVNSWKDKTQIKDFKEVWPSMFPSPDSVHLIPGNHDIDSECTDASIVLEHLEHYRSTFTRQDYSAFETRFGSFVLINSEMLILPYLGLNNTKDPKILDPVEEQWTFIETQLKVAQSRNVHTVVVTHHPPFLKTEDESHQYFNMPLPPRQRLLALARRYNVRTFLCGHTHTTGNVSTSDGINIFLTAGTSKAFDKNGCGYRILTLSESSLDIRYIELPGGGGTPGCVPSVHPRFQEFGWPSLP